MTEKKLPKFFKQPKSRSSVNPFLKGGVLFFLFVVFLFVYQIFFKSIAFESFGRDELFANSQQLSRVEREQAYREWFRVLQKSEESQDFETLQSMKPEKFQAEMLLKGLEREVLNDSQGGHSISLKPILGVLGFSSDSLIRKGYQQFLKKHHARLSSEDLLVATISAARLLEDSVFFLSFLEKNVARREASLSTVSVVSLRHFLSKNEGLGGVSEKELQPLFRAFLRKQLEEASQRNWRWNTLLALADLKDPVVEGAFESVFLEIEAIEESFSALEVAKVQLYEELINAAMHYNRRDWVRQIQEWAETHPHVKLRSLAKKALEKSKARPL